jgi:PLP dependent protein
MDISANIEKIKSSIPAHVKLVAVSKTKPNDYILDAYKAGQKIFGENKVQEIAAKYESLPKDIEWHFIGHMQTNKVKYIAPFVDLMHGVDSMKLLKVIEKEGAKNNRIINCLLQFHIAEEATKFGLSQKEAENILQDAEYNMMKHVKINGVMGMATYTNEQNQLHREFGQLKIIFDALKEKYFKNDASFREVSMGMSGDYQIAIEQGATIIRLGSVIFGERMYH